ncbi:MAG: hypothetical protein LQ345_006314 [Seirophora villosa]|nr:MAG: hypothetical protein LQ345_006314 [Seirophora villosa]
MDSQFTYPLPAGLHVIPNDLLDVRPDDEVDHHLLHPPPVSDEKNVWFFWHTGYTRMHPCSQRTIRAWHRRFSKQGWVIRVLDRQPSSPLNVANFLDVTDPAIFPRAFTDGTIGGDYAPQHTSDLVRWPLLLRYGGVYADVGLMQIGDLDRLWRETVANPDSPVEVLAYDGGPLADRSITNYFYAARRDNPLFLRCHRLLMALWAADGGKVEVQGMHRSPLLRGVPLSGEEATIGAPPGQEKIGVEDTRRLLTDYFIQGMRRSLLSRGVPLTDGEEATIDEAGQVKMGVEHMRRSLTDYIIQVQVTTMVLGLVDEEDGWHGPEYHSKRVYSIDFVEGGFLINDFTQWDGRKAFHLMSLPLPRAGEEEESEEQQLARNIVEACLRRSFAVKLPHGLIEMVIGATLGSLWREHEGSDDVPGTYAHLLRHGTMYWNQDGIPPPVKYGVLEPIKRGSLLQAA